MHWPRCFAFKKACGISILGKNFQKGPKTTPGSGGGQMVGRGELGGIPTVPPGYPGFSPLWGRRRGAKGNGPRWGPFPFGDGAPRARGKATGKPAPFSIRTPRGTSGANAQPIGTISPFPSSGGVRPHEAGGEESPPRGGRRPGKKGPMMAMGSEFRTWGKPSPRRRGGCLPPARRRP